MTRCLIDGSWSVNYDSRSAIDDSRINVHLPLINRRLTMFFCEYVSYSDRLFLALVTLGDSTHRGSFLFVVFRHPRRLVAKVSTVVNVALREILLKGKAQYS